MKKVRGGLVQKFEFADGLKNAGRFCATLSRFKYRESLDRGVIPYRNEPTATVTFVKFEGKTYAITSRHVILQFDKLAASEGCDREGYFCPCEPGITILGPFVTPPESLDYQKPDISICPIDNDLPSLIGKEAFVFTPESNVLSWPVPYALAVGFPTASKADRLSEIGSRLAMQCVNAVAEGVGSPGNADQIQFFSELPDGTTVPSLSGMSGGPVFWSVGEAFGLLGFVKETMNMTSSSGTNSPASPPQVHFLSQRVDYEILKCWLSYVDKKHPFAREKANASIRCKNV